jgi:hypothetical protein
MGTSGRRLLDGHCKRRGLWTMILDILIVTETLEIWTAESRNRRRNAGTVFSMDEQLPGSLQDSLFLS